MKLSFDNAHTNSTLFYCGRMVGQRGYHRPCGTCDGRCGPTNGCQCYDCHELSMRGYSSSAVAEDMCACDETDAADLGGDSDPTLKVEMTEDLAWNKSTLTVGFYPPPAGTLSSGMRANIMELAREWTWYGNINLEVASAVQNADIRIAFNDGSNNTKGGYWSHMGRTCANVAKGAPTMNLQNHHLKIIPRKVRHEFGHALGFYHEHQLRDKSGGLAMDYNPKEVLKYYKTHSSWDAEKTQHNVLNTRVKSGKYATKCDGAGIDQFSVMLYPLKDGKLLLNPGDAHHYPCKESAELSVEDILYVMRMYPGRKPDGFSYTDSSFRCRRCCQSKSGRTNPLYKGNPRFDFQKNGLCLACALSSSYRYICRTCQHTQEIPYQLPSECSWSCRGCNTYSYWRPIFS